jgi:Sulfotransferase domain
MPTMPRSKSPAVIIGGQEMTVLGDSRPAIMVVSHERSGTHFLMTALARGYGYVAKPWIDFDWHHNQINFFLPLKVEQTLLTLSNQHLANIVKTHHAVEFFDGILDRLLSRYLIFYVHRNPTDVMLSYWRFINSWQWREGPKRDDVLAFASAEPEGMMMRYQMQQHRNVLHRWASHALGWVAAAENRPRLRIVAYADLNDSYAKTLTGFSSLFGRLPADTSMPPRGLGVRSSNQWRPPADRPPDVTGLKALALDEVGEAMRTLGYA